MTVFPKQKFSQSIFGEKKSRKKNGGKFRFRQKKLRHRN
jgi:hypothetical protein